MSRFGIIDSASKIVASGLKLHLDAAQTASYGGSGTSWSDISGGGATFTLTNGPTFTTEFGGGIVFDGSNDIAIGPASNSLGLGSDHTIELVIKPTQAVGGATFKFGATGAFENRGIFAHTPYFDGYYYDTPAGNRISFIDSGLINVVSYFVFRRRAATTPRQEIYRNNVQRANSGTGTLNTLTLNSDPIYLGKNSPSIAEAFKGNIYIFRVYDRALTDTELTNNFNATRIRFSI